MDLGLAPDEAVGAAGPLLRDAVQADLSALLVWREADLEVQWLDPAPGVDTQMAEEHLRALAWQYQGACTPTYLDADDRWAGGAGTRLAAARVTR